MNIAELAKYQKIAEGLYEQGYYSGLLSAVESCLKTGNTFVILDCPSGTGKTLAAVALSMQSRNRNPNSKLTFNGFPADIYHFIWPTAVDGQDIYKQINACFRINSSFFVGIMDVKETMEALELWTILKKAIPDIDASDIAAGQRVLVLIIDEVPEDPAEIERLGQIRDALKKLLHVCLILCGTHSKAANMVEISQTSASRIDNRAVERWAWIVTRLPRFDLELSGLQVTMKAWTKRIDYVYVTSAISHSVSNGGNPWLITVAILAASTLASSMVEVELQGEELENAARRIFLRWQDLFSRQIFEQKFSEKSISRGFKGLSAQLNLLLDASATSQLSDVMLGYHFATRCIPDSCRLCGTDKKANLNDCGGCLYFAPPESRAKGNSLHFFRGTSDASNQKGLPSWQLSSFASPQKDILLYLMACRKEGYLTVSLPPESFYTYEVLLSCWRSNSTGLVNFQNPSAVSNSGLLEMLLVAAVKNAAAKSSEGNTDCSAVEFLALLLREMGLPDFSSLPTQIARDTTLIEIRVPRIIVPTQESQLTDFPKLGGILGIAERKQNKDEFQFLVKCISSERGSSIRLEAKDKRAFNTGEMATLASKLFRNGNRVGIIIVRNCCQYWGTDARNIENRAIFAALLRQIRGLGRAYLISRNMAFEEISVSPCTAETSRLFVVQVPETSLCAFL